METRGSKGYHRDTNSPTILCLTRESSLRGCVRRGGAHLGGSIQLDRAQRTQHQPVIWKACVIGISLQGPAWAFHDVETIHGTGGTVLGGRRLS